MNHYMDFDPYLIHQRNEEMVREVNSVRLEAGLQHIKDDQERKEKTMINNAVSKVMWVGKDMVFMVGLAIMVALMIGATSVARPAHAQGTVTVNTAADEENTDGDCSLREAIIAANTNVAVDACMAGSATSEDLIRFADGVGGMSLDGQLPHITDAKGLVINGSPTPIIPASRGFRAFWVDPGAKLTLTNISLNNYSVSGDGAAVLNTGWLKVIGSDLSNNTSTAPGGGFGGAIWNTGRLEVTSSSFYGNSSNVDGRAIASGSAAYTARISKSTFANNTGGVSAVYHGSGKMEVTTSTFANNDRIGIIDYSGDLTVISSTFFRNTYSNIGHSSLNGEVAILSTILEKNPDSPGGNCAGDSLIDGGYNVSNDDSCGFSVAHHSLSDTDPLLDPFGLQDNGGPTETIALQPTSPAIDNVEIYGAVYPPGSNYNNGCGYGDSQDQRGEKKPQGSACDAGAFEAPPDVTAPSVPTIASPAEGIIFNTRSFTLSGTAEVNSTVELFEGADSKGTTKADLSGNWSIDLSGVSDGSHSYAAKATDKAGNTSNESGARTLTVDTTVPEVPIITSPPEGSFDNDGFFFVVGTAEPGAKVELFDDATSKGTTTAGSDGRWNLALSRVAEGLHSFKAKATDAAGNASAESDARTVTVDATAPSVRRVLPTEDATGIAPGANVSALFSEAMRAGSINNAFKLYKKGSTSAITATVTYDAATKRVVLNPSSNLQRGATYKAVVSAGARDLAGNALDQNQSLTGNQQKAWFFKISQ